MRHEKKLCYYCDEKYKVGHKCKHKQIFLLEGEESEEKTMNEGSTEVEVDPVVSIHALSRSILLTNHEDTRKH